MDMRLNFIKRSVLKIFAIFILLAFSLASGQSSLENIKSIPLIKKGSDGKNPQTKPITSPRITEYGLKKNGFDKASIARESSVFDSVNQVFNVQNFNAFSIDSMALIKPHRDALYTTEPCHVVLSEDADITYRIPTGASKDVILLNENFDSYTGYSTNGTIPPSPWSRYPTSGYTWGNDYGINYITPHSGVNYMWCDGKEYNSYYDYYHDYMDSWLIYGPFDLSSYESASLDFWTVVRTETDYDFAFWLASTDGSNFYGYWITGYPNSGNWFSVSFDLSAVPTLGDVTGQPNVWIAFDFYSDESGYDDGYYIDDVVLDVTNCDKVTDHGGADWIISSTQTVYGNHTNIGTFRVNYGVTLNVDSDCHFFTVSADIVDVQGTINGNGCGSSGGLYGEIGGGCWGTAEGGGAGEAGNGSGGGYGGTGGDCGGGSILDYGGGGGGGSGGGGGYGAAGGAAGGSGDGGGDGGDGYCTGSCDGGDGGSAGSSGGTYGTSTGTDFSAGSGGAGGGAGGGTDSYYGDYGNDGGNGGGGVKLVSSSDMTITGNIYVNGAPGLIGGQGGYGEESALGYGSGGGGGGGGSGGGSGGAIYLDCHGDLGISGNLTANGGSGGTGGTGGYSEEGYGGNGGSGGGGGGGGRIKIFCDICGGSVDYASATMTANGGSGGSAGSGGSGYWNGSSGSAGNSGSTGTIEIISGTGPGSPGEWTGMQDNDWDNPCNWGDYQVPTSITAVNIPASVSSGRWPAKSGNLTISGSGADCASITMNGTSQLTVTGNWINNTVSGFSAGSGTVIFDGSGTNTIQGSQVTTFNNVRIDIGKTIQVDSGISSSGYDCIIKHLDTTNDGSSPGGRFRPEAARVNISGP